MMQYRDTVPKKTSLASEKYLPQAWCPHPLNHRT